MSKGQFLIFDITLHSHLIEENKRGTYAFRSNLWLSWCSVYRQLSFRLLWTSLCPLPFIYYDHLPPFYGHLSGCNHITVRWYQLVRCT